MNLSCVFIGAGNLATNLSLALFQNGIKVKQIYNRTGQSASDLANRVGAGFTSELNEIDPTADVYFVALKDSVYDEILSKIEFGNRLIVHCSGSMPLSSLENYSENRGVLYPLQTFSKSRKINFREIPVFIEANTAENQAKLHELASMISNSVQFMDSEKRKYLHISAVFACNFVNHMYNIASQILKSKDIPFEVLRPLILETALKVQENLPENSQTGPAVRFDNQIIEKHMETLKESGNFAEIYERLSKSIFEFYSAGK